MAFAADLDHPRQDRKGKHLNTMCVLRLIREASLLCYASQLSWCVGENWALEKIVELKYKALLWQCTLNNKRKGKRVRGQMKQLKGEWEIIPFAQIIDNKANRTKNNAAQCRFHT